MKELLLLIGIKSTGVLNTIEDSKAINHMFMPSGGRVDLMGILPTFENG